jgi:regulator of sirC expression with transglutaminase-like and TPR domain
MASHSTDTAPDKTALRRRLAELAYRRHEAADLAEAALLIAAEAYPHLDMRAALAEIERMAGLARARLHGKRQPSPTETAFLLTRLLYEEEGFRGNATAYHDARNSYLNAVLERRLGIPITLAIVYLEVARRAGIQARGIGFPGHFLVKHLGPPDVLVDPFTGAVLTAEDCRRRLEATLGTGAHNLSDYLAAATPLDILVRVLRNLKQIHLEGEEPLQALAASERILMLLPDQPEELRDRGLAYEQLECFPEAASDLERSLQLAPDQPQADLLRRHVSGLLRRANRVN